MSNSVFTSDTWLEWSERVTRQRAEFFEVATEFGTVRGVWYRDGRNRIRQIPLMPYLALATDDVESRRVGSRAAVALTDAVAERLAGERIHGGIVLPPEWSDARPFQWRGFIADVRYTYLIRLPHAGHLINRAVLKRARKAARLGYTFHAERDDDALIRCLESTEKRQHFSHGIPIREIPALLDALPADMYRCHVVRDSQGSPVSAGVRLRSGKTTAHDWVQGSDADSLRDGVVQLMYSGVLDDLASQQYGVFDFGGANIRAVAAAKAEWGGELVPMAMIRDARAETLLRTWVLSRRKKS